MVSTTASTAHGSWTSPFVPKLKSEDSPIGVQLTTIETSLVVSLYILGYFLGSVLTIRAYDIFGRKTMFIVANVLNLLAWICIFFAHSPVTLYIARVIAGMGAIICVHVSSMYTGEISDNDNRGIMGYLNVLLSACGSVLGLVIGPYVSYKIFAIIGICTVLFAIVCILLIPESPYFLIKKHRHEETEKVIWKLASNASGKEFVNKRLEEITTSVQRDMQNKSSIRELFSGKYTKCLLIHIGLYVILYMSGSAIIKSYLQTILFASESTLSSENSSAIFGIVNIAAVFLSGQVVDRLGRKPLLLVSCTFSAICMFILGVYFYILENFSLDMEVVAWLPLTSLVVYVIFIAIGVGPIPHVVISELYSMNIKGIAVGTVGALLTPIAIIVQMGYEFLNEFWGLSGTFWMFSAFCVFGIFFALFVLPETKGKSFQQIQMEISGKKWTEADGLENNTHF